MGCNAKLKALFTLLDIKGDVCQISAEGFLGLTRACRLLEERVRRGWRGLQEAVTKSGIDWQGV